MTDYAYDISGSWPNLQVKLDDVVHTSHRYDNTTTENHTFAPPSATAANYKCYSRTIKSDGTVSGVTEISLTNSKFPLATDTTKDHMILMFVEPGTGSNITFTLKKSGVH